MKSINRDVLALAAPALGTLMAEPLLLAADSIMVGRLGESQLAALSAATAIVGTATGLFIFLTYVTTASAAKRLGAGDRAGAVSLGIDGLWLGAGLGAALAVGMYFAAPALAAAMGTTGAIAAHTVTYLRASAPGLLGMLVVLAGNGALRGLMDGKTPFYVAAGGAAGNVALNALFIYGFGWGIAGSGAGTAVAQTAMAAALVARVAVGARELGVGWRPAAGGVLATFKTGIALFVRTLAMWVAILTTVRVATWLGPTELAAYQVVRANYVVFSYPADAFAMAAQSLVGHALGTRDRAYGRRVMRVCMAWGLATGAVLGLIAGALSGVLPWAYTESAAVAEQARWALLVVAIGMPISSWAFLGDGILIGADESKFLAVGALIMLAVYLPALGALVWGLGPHANLMWLWGAFMAGFLGVRGITNSYRMRRLF